MQDILGLLASIIAKHYSSWRKKNLDEVAISKSLTFSSSNYKSLRGGESLGPNDN